MMYIFRFLLLALFTTLLPFNLSGSEPLPKKSMSIVLNSATSAIENSLSSMDSTLSAASLRLAIAGLSGSDAEKILNEVQGTLPNSSGKIISVQPANQKPSMSNFFRSFDGTYGMEARYPIINKQLQPVGALSLFFRSELLLQRCIEQAVAGTDIKIWVISSDGTMLYDSLPDHIGLNLFAAPLSRHRSVQVIGWRIIKEKQGSGRYSLPQAKENITKNAIWKTVSLYGKEWRVVACETATASLR